MPSTTPWWKTPAGTGWTPCCAWCRPRGPRSTVRRRMDCRPTWTRWKAGSSARELLVLQALAQLGLEHLAVVVLRQCVHDHIALGPLEARDALQADSIQGSRVDHPA